MTLLRRLLGYLILLVSRAILWVGTWLSLFGWWLMDREDMIRLIGNITTRVNDAMGHAEK